MAQYRTIKMNFWSDPYTENLTAIEKLLYVYLFTCQHTNNLGILEISFNKIAFETGVSIDDVNKAINKFSNDKKLYYDKELSIILLYNFIRHQCSKSTTVIKGLIDLFEDLKNEKIKYLLSIRYNNIFEEQNNPFNDIDTISDYIDTISDYIDTISNDIDTVTIPPEVLVKVIKGKGKGYTQKKSFGEFLNVQLYEEEFEKLVNRFGESEAMKKINTLDLYIGSKGVKYKSHYMTILQWESKATPAQTIQHDRNAVIN